MEPKIERVEVNIGFGEGPHWDIENQCLYFVDITSKSINRYEPATEKHTKASFDDVYASFIIPLEGEKNKFVVGLGRHIVLVTWDGQSENVQQTERLVEIQNPGPNIQYKTNDGKCDTVGRLWTGTTTCEWKHVEHGSMGSIYSYKKGSLKNHAGEVTFSNGLCWSKDNKKFFYIDSIKRAIDQFDFDINTEKITNRTVLFSYDENSVDGFADGMTIDEDDNLWIANFGASCVIKIDSKVHNSLLYTLKLPFNNVTSVAWGGENLDELYVTVGRMSDTGVFNGPLDCPIYKVSGLGTKGLPMSNFRY